VRVRYFGWSGVAIEHAGLTVGVDLFGDAVGWVALDADGPVVLCATHGHPEHCGAYRRLLSERPDPTEGPEVHFVASSRVADHAAPGGILPPERVHPVEAGDAVALDGLDLAVFRWEHLPLLPPGLGEKASYLARLAARPFHLARIALSGLRLPLWAPTHGFHLAFADGRTVLDYAEGLHRLTDADEVREVARRLPAEVLLFAVEPEDADAVPRWIEVLGPSSVILYEAHRPWRELFGLPYVELEDYADRLSKRFPSVAFHPLTEPGQTTSP